MTDLVQSITQIHKTLLVTSDYGLVVVICVCFNVHLKSCLCQTIYFNFKVLTMYTNTIFVFDSLHFLLY